MTPEQIDAMAARADHLCELGRWAEAERALGRVLGVAPDHYDALSRLTEVLENLDRPEDAAEVARLIDQPDETLADLAWEGVCATILNDPRTAEPSGPTAAAITLRAALPDLTAFTAHEGALLGDWLDRIADSA